MSDLHVAIIMDGNGRWAKAQGKPRLVGHQQGASVMRRLLKSAPSLGISTMTLYAFSIENWMRPLEEVTGLMTLFEHYLRKEVSELVKDGVCLRFLGDRGRLSPVLQDLMQAAEKATEGLSSFHLYIAMNYGGRQDIATAASTMLEHVRQEGMPADGVTPDFLGRFFQTAGCKDPDLLIRTGGEMRLSNFLLWQLSYTELYFSPKNWPDFTIDDLRMAIENFYQRSRRFGALDAQAV